MVKKQTNTKLGWCGTRVHNCESVVKFVKISLHSNVSSQDPPTNLPTHTHNPSTPPLKNLSPYGKFCQSKLIKLLVKLVLCIFCLFYIGTLPDLLSACYLRSAVAKPYSVTHSKGVCALVFFTTTYCSFAQLAHQNVTCKTQHVGHVLVCVFFLPVVSQLCECFPLRL